MGKTAKKKDEQIMELKDRITMLSETNDSLRKEANEFSKTEISLRRAIANVRNVTSFDAHIFNVFISLNKS